MGIFDKAKDLAGQHDDKIDQGIEQAGDFVDDRSGGQHEAHVDKAQDFLQDRTGDGDTVQADGGEPQAEGEQQQ